MAVRYTSNVSGGLGGGCLVLFGLPFVGFGLFALWHAFKELNAGKWRSGLPAVIFALVFCGVGFGVMALGIFGARKGRKQKALEAQHPNEPWLYREDWARGEIKAGGKTGLVFIWIFALFWNAISWGAFSSILHQPRQGQGIYLVVIFPLVGLGLLILAVHQLLRWRRFGDSIFKLTTIPGVIGGALAGVVHPSGQLARAREIRLHLGCFDRDSSGDSVNERVEWEDEKLLSGEVLQGGGIPVVFNIPFDCKPTATLSASHSTVWRLHVTAKLPGTDYAAQFEVPLFKTQASRADAPKLIDPTAAYEKPIETMLPKGITVRPAGNGGTEFHFAAARNKSAGLFLTAFTLIWTGSIVLMLKLKAPIGFPIVFGLFDILMLLGVIGVWTGTTRVVTDLNGLRVTSHWAGVASSRFLAAADVQSIESKLGMSSGNTTYYDLLAVTTAGKKIKLASSIRGKKESEWFAHEIQKALGKK